MVYFENDPGYEECIVSYLDILGFRHIINTICAERIKIMLNGFRRITKPIDFELEDQDEPRPYSEVRTEIVSDAVVRARTIHTKYRSGPLLSELVDLMYIQMECIANGLFVRGAMTIDYLHVGPELEGPFFGPALIRAYEMEENEVIFPRIAVENKIVERLKSDKSLWWEGHTLKYELGSFAEITKTDESGLRFIDYLNAGPGNFDEGYAGYFAFLETHKNLIEKGLSSTDSKNTIKKFNWLKNYHNNRIEHEMEKVNPVQFVPEFECTMFDILNPLRIV